MLNYFHLQLKILNRKIIDFGIPLLIGYIVIITIFILLSNSLFNRTSYAELIYIVTALSFVIKLKNTKRCQFLKNSFNKKDYNKLRLLENFIYIMPFILFLIYKALFICAILLLAFALLMGLIKFSFNLNYTIPTPFSKNPFEFIIGFRKTFFIFPLAYFLCFKSISASNLNLGLFTMMLIALTCSSFYLKPENEYFIWSFNLSPKQFLFEKVKICFINYSILCFPIILTLNSFFFIDFITIVSTYVLCLTFLSAIIFSKYSAYPNEINIPEVLLIIICLIFPPVIIGVIPYLYIKSIKKIKPFLE